MKIKPLQINDVVVVLNGGMYSSEYLGVGALGLITELRPPNSCGVVIDPMGTYEKYAWDYKEKQLEKIGVL